MKTTKIVAKVVKHTQTHATTFNIKKVRKKKQAKEFEIMGKV